MVSIAAVRRVVLFGVFVTGLGWAYLATAGAPSGVPPIGTILTEEGQLVAFDKSTWQLRELAKRVAPGDSTTSGNFSAMNS